MTPRWKCSCLARWVFFVLFTIGTDAYTFICARKKFLGTSLTGKQTINEFLSCIKWLKAWAFLINDQLNLFGKGTIGKRRTLQSHRKRLQSERIPLMTSPLHSPRLGSCQYIPRKPLHLIIIWIRIDKSDLYTFFRSLFPPDKRTQWWFKIYYLCMYITRISHPDKFKWTRFVRKP